MSSVNYGFNFLLEHLNSDYLFPRTIMTKKLGKQITVYSADESMKYFEDSEYVDCRINAFPLYVDYHGLQRYPPDFVFIDLDANNFRSDKELRSSLSKTLRKMSQIFGSKSTVLWTGNGYHVYQPLESIVLEQCDIFAKFQDPSKQFLRFAKNFLSSNRADASNNPSFKSCLLRIPYSVNSKCVIQCTNTNINIQNHITSCHDKSCVKIIQNWDGHRPSIKYLLRDFLHYLINQEIKKRKKIEEEASKKAKYKNRLSASSSSSSSSLPRNKERKEIEWIEHLLKIPIADYRKHVVSLILTSYLVNIKKMSYHESICILTDWLSKCNKVRKLDFNPDLLIRSSLNTAVSKGIPPMKLETLKNRNLYVYQQVHYHHQV
ncbi:MAG: DNA primase noncatalytic subunit PriX [Candidatus Nitrosocosmicus sp.]|nr:DNA primase noncatalytic subunit PriX [Candidatus Nitrosocosmicus sp.]